MGIHFHHQKIQRKGIVNQIVAFVSLSFWQFLCQIDSRCNHWLTYFLVRMMQRRLQIDSSEEDGRMIDDQIRPYDSLVSWRTAIWFRGSHYNGHSWFQQCGFSMTPCNRCMLVGLSSDVSTLLLISSLCNVLTNCFPVCSTNVPCCRCVSVNVIDSALCLEQMLKMGELVLVCLSECQMSF